MLFSFYKNNIMKLYKNNNFISARTILFSHTHRISWCYLAAATCPQTVKMTYHQHLDGG